MVGRGFLPPGTSLSLGTTAQHSHETQKRLPFKDSEESNHQPLIRKRDLLQGRMQPSVKKRRGEIAGF